MLVKNGIAVPEDKPLDKSAFGCLGVLVAVLGVVPAFCLLSDTHPNRQPGLGVLFQIMLVAGAIIIGFTLLGKWLTARRSNKRAADRREFQRKHATMKAALLAKEPELAQLDAALERAERELAKVPPSSPAESEEDGPRLAICEEIVSKIVGQRVTQEDIALLCDIALRSAGLKVEKWGSPCSSELDEAVSTAVKVSPNLEKKFGVSTSQFQMPSPEPALMPTCSTQLEAYNWIISMYPGFRREQKIAAIKALKEALPELGLAEAKAIIESEPEQIRKLAARNSGRIVS